MSTSVLVAIAGALVAAVGTGRQAGQCVRRPRTSLVACSVGMLAITVALLAQGLGFATGFGPWTFRIIQLSAQLVAPLVLVWGLVEVVARAAAVRFGARLVAAAVTVVAGVVLATDPLSGAGFGKDWPSPSVYYQILPHYVLILVALLTGVGALAVLAVCATRGRRVPADGSLVIGVAAVTVTVLLLIALRFSLPGPAYPALGLVAAGVLWFGTARLEARAVRPAGPVGPAAAGQVRADQADHAGVTGANRRAVASEAEGADGVKWSRGNKGERGSRGADDRGGRDGRGGDRGDRGGRADDRGGRRGDGRDGRRGDDRAVGPASAGSGRPTTSCATRWRGRRPGTISVSRTSRPQGGRRAAGTTGPSRKGPARKGSARKGAARTDLAGSGPAPGRATSRVSPAPNRPRGCSTRRCRGWTYRCPQRRPRPRPSPAPTWPCRSPRRTACHLAGHALAADHQRHERDRQQGGVHVCRRFLNLYACLLQRRAC
jgi:hypothetical protein